MSCFCIVYGMAESIVKDAIRGCLRAIVLQSRLLELVIFVAARSVNRTRYSLAHHTRESVGCSEVHSDIA